MKRELNEKGQFDISFGMIFSIIIIIAIVAIAVYVINYFLNLSKCNQVAFFYDDIKTEVDNAWTSGITSDIYTGKLPSGIEEVCFGNLTRGAGTKYKTEYDALSLFKYLDKNLFLYPGTKACDSSLAYYKIQHAKTAAGTPFFCVPVQGGQIQIMLTKSETDPLVTISERK